MNKVYLSIFIVLFVLLLPAVAMAQISVQGRQNFDFNAQPGQSHEGLAVVQNTSGSTQSVRVYQTDYSFSPAGETYSEPGEATRSNADWVAFSPSAFTLGPGETRTVHFSVTVPNSEALAGSYWSMIMVEAQAVDASALTEDSEESTLRLNVMMRYGLQIHTRLPGTAAPEVAFLGAKLLGNDADARRLQVDVENTGESMTGPAAWVELYHENGIQVGRAKTSSYRIYPGTSVRYDFDLPELIPGNYEALVVLDAGSDDVYGAQYSLKL